VSPNLRAPPLEEVGLGRTAMSEREMRRAAVLAQVKKEAWTLVEAAERMELSYRQGKRLWKRYQSKGAAGLVHRSVGRISNRAKPRKVRAKVVRLIRQKYSGEVGRRFGPTLAAEHLASEDQIELSATTVRSWMLAEGLGSRARKVREHRQRRARRETSANWCNSTEAFMNGWNNAGRAAA
jgi:predicted chitinase